MVKCEKCKKEVSRESMIQGNYICPSCGKYNKLPGRIRIEQICDKGKFQEMWGEVQSKDPLHFPSYTEKYQAARDKTGENEGVICGKAKIGGISCMLFVMEPGFMLASMGTVLGDKLTATFEYATKHKLPVVGFSASGGARMQEGMLSLMQMAKVSGAVKYHSEAGLLYVVCNTDPTTGGVTASFAMLGDIVLAEPGATIGFAGKRVIEQVTGESLPENFQSSEFQFEKGFVDAIVERGDMKNYITRVLELHCA